MILSSSIIKEMINNNSLREEIVIPCEWLLVGKKAKCYRLSVRGEEYCPQHMYRIRRGYVIPTPCRRCKNGTKTYSHFCTECVSMIKIENRYEINYNEWNDKQLLNRFLKELFKNRKKELAAGLRMQLNEWNDKWNNKRLFNLVLKELLEKTARL